MCATLALCLRLFSLQRGEVYWLLQDCWITFQSVPLKVFHNRDTPGDVYD